MEVFIWRILNIFALCCKLGIRVSEVPMASRFFVTLMTAAFFAAPFFSPLAIAEEAGAEPEAPVESTAAPGQAAQPSQKSEAAQKLSANVCEITGVVAKLENVERSPWSDGTPTTLSAFEVDIAVTVKDRKPHYKNAPANSVCHRAAKGETRIYKLCSTTVPKAGDRIHATEGLQTGSRRSTGCLFDVVVIPPAEGEKKKI